MFTATNGTHPLYVVPAGDVKALSLLGHFNDRISLEIGSEEIVCVPSNICTRDALIYERAFVPVDEVVLTRLALNILDNKCRRDSTLVILNTGVFQLLCAEYAFRKYFTTPLERRYRVAFVPFRQNLSSLRGAWYVLRSLENGFQLEPIRKEATTEQKMQLWLQ